LFGHFIVALQKQRAVVWVYATDAVLALAAYAIFIPQYGSTAAAYATFGSEVYAAIILVWVVMRTVGGRIMLGTFMRVCGAVAVMTMALWVMGDSFSLLATVVCGGFIYGGVGYVLNIHKKFL
jgi:O-antigen/teichoic acid export membrane protein